METGSIVVGADGGHSHVRRLVLANEPRSFAGEMRFTEHCFNIIFGRSPLPHGLKKRNGQFLNRHGHGWFIQFIPMGVDSVGWNLYMYRRGGVSEEPIFFDKADEGRLVEKYLDERIVDDVTFRDLWETREFSKLDYMTEGVAKTWSERRVVLVGDSSVKVSQQTFDRLRR